MKLALGLCLLIELLGFAASAAVVPFLSSMVHGTKLTIPDGKVVVFDHMQTTSRTVSISIFYNTHSSGINSYVGRTDLVYTNPTPGLVIALPAPIRLPGGWTVSNSTSALVYFFGLAMDAADLYGGVGSEIDGVAVAAGALQGDVQLASPRPIVANVEQSEDLLTWMPNEAAILQRGANPTQLQFTTPLDNPNRFYRLKTRSRRTAD